MRSWSSAVGVRARRAMSTISRACGRRSSVLTVPPCLASARSGDAGLKDFAGVAETRTNRIFVEAEHFGNLDARELLDFVKDEHLALDLGHLVEHLVENLKSGFLLEGFGGTAA